MRGPTQHVELAAGLMLLLETGCYGYLDFFFLQKVYHNINLSVPHF